MSRTTPNDPDTVVPELATAIAEVDRTFTALRAARSKFNRCSKPANREAARVAMVEAEAAYRVASDRRDELVQVRNARMTQRGDERGALWSRPEVGGPVVGELIVNGANLGTAVKHADGRVEAGPHVRARVKLTRAGGYDPKLGPKHPDNQDPTLEQPIVKLPDPDLQRAVDALRKVGAINATVTLADGRVLVFRGGPFGTVEIMHQ